MSIVNSWQQLCAALAREEEKEWSWASKRFCMLAARKVK
jgi:hypothetical protein